MKNREAHLPKTDFVNSMKQGEKNQKITRAGVVIILAVVIVVSVIAGMHMGRLGKIKKGKAAIAQLDIQSTYREPEFEDDGDWDGDGLTNITEKQGSTNIQNEDTDGDGILDGDELALGLDPNNKDTDGDGMLDGYEIMAGTNPRLKKTDGKTADNALDLTIKKKYGDCTVTLKGNPNIAGATVEELDIFGISSNASLFSKAYDFYSEYKYDTADITIAVDHERLLGSGYTYDDLSVLKFDVDKQKYTALQSTADENSRTVTARIKESGTYMVGAQKTVNEPSTTRIAFLIDNSGSMYPKELCATSTENDVEFKRLDFAGALIDKFDKGYLVSISKFTGTYTRMSDFTDDKTQLEGALNSIREEPEVFNGTHNQTALKSCIEEFSLHDEGKYRNIIVMLSDGESDEADPATAEELSLMARERSIIILTVGLGRDIDREWLQSLAYSTGGKYYSAYDANALDDVYKQIVTTFNYEIVKYSSDEDKISGYSLFNTGFDPERNGFSFKNFRTTTTASVDFGMALLARDWYLGNVHMYMDDLKPGDRSSQKVDAKGYDLTGTHIGDAYENRRPLHEIAPEVFLDNYSNVDDYLDYDRTTTDLKIREDLRADAESKGWKVETRELEAANVIWKSVEMLDLDIANGLEKIANGYNESDAQLCALLYRLNAVQWDDESYEFDLTGGEEGFERLQYLLSLGVPVVTTIDERHTVNTVAMIRDSSCNRKYILRVYDNNYPDKLKDLYIEKKPVAYLDINGEYVTVRENAFTYQAVYEGKRVGVSFTNVNAH